MPVETNIANLSQTAASNSPPGSESPTTIDDYHRQALAFIAQHRDGKGFAAEVDVASAATCDIGAANSMFVRITGTTTITSFGTPSLNGPRFIRFQSALTLTHNATSLILPGGASITTAAGDTCIAIPIPSGGGWYVSNYQRAAAAPAFSAYKSSSQSVSSGVSTKVTFDVEDFDTAGAFASSRWTPGVAGVYDISATASLSVGTNGMTGLIELYVNGVAHTRGSQANALDAGLFSSVLTAKVQLDADDYIEIYANVLGSTPSVGGGASPRLTHFSGCLVRAS